MRNSIFSRAYTTPVSGIDCYVGDDRVLHPNYKLDFGNEVVAHQNNVGFSSLMDIVDNQVETNTNTSMLKFLTSLISKLT